MDKVNSRYPSEGGSTISLETMILPVLERRSGQEIIIKIALSSEESAILLVTLEKMSTCQKKCYKEIEK